MALAPGDPGYVNPGNSPKPYNPSSNPFQSLPPGTQTPDQINQGKLASLPSWETGDLSRQNPLPWQAYLPNEIANSAGGLAEGIQAKGEDPNYLKGQLMQGVSQDSTTHLGAGSSLGANSPMSSAISKRYQNSLGNKLSQFQNTANASADSMRSQEENKAAQMYGSDQQIAQANYKEQYQYQMQRQQLYNAYQNANNAADSQMISQIIQGAATALPIIAAAAA